MGGPGWRTFLLALIVAYACAAKEAQAQDQKAGVAPVQPSTYDYIVVGAGASGAVVASRLAEQGQRVLVLETGDDEHLNPLTTWGFFFPSTFYSHVYRNYFTEPEPTVNNRRLYHMSTKALGGGTAVNAMVWTWGDRRDWDLIPDLEGWTFDEVLPYFKKSETFTGLDPEGVRGKHGPIILGSFAPNNATLAAVQTASKVFGVPVESDNNGGIHESSAIVQRNFRGATVDTGERMDMSTVYLKPTLLRRPQFLEVVTHATVVEILLDGSEDPPRARGVRYLREGQCQQAFASEEVIVSAGAYNSPKLLLLSGIGDCQHLDDVGIACKVESREVGRNLVDHINPGSLLFAGPPRKDYDANIVAAYTRTKVVDDLTPDVELGFIVGPPSEVQAVWEHLPALYVFYSLWLLHDGVGSIRLKNKDPLEDPVLVSGYLRTMNDEKRLVKLFRMLVNWAEEFRKATNITWVQQPSGGNAIFVTNSSSDAEILSAAKTVLSTHWHVAQSCKMGPPVVDPQFRVYGVEGLRVVDASSQPVMTNGHPQSVLVMMAERAADFIKEDRRQKGSSSSSSSSNQDRKSTTTP